MRGWWWQAAVGENTHSIRKKFDRQVRYCTSDRNKVSDVVRDLRGESLGGREGKPIHTSSGEEGNKKQKDGKVAVRIKQHRKQ